MKLKAKLTFGVGFLFFMILLLAIVSGYYVYRLKKDTNHILVDNYNTLHYSRNMLLALEDLDSNGKSMALFEDNLRLQKRNVTEPGERAVTERVDHHFLSLKKKVKDATIAADLHKDIFQLMYLNMQAIEHKNNIANETAEKAILAISIVGALSFMIAFVLLVNLPLAIAAPIVQLTDSIKQIAAGTIKGDFTLSEKMNLEKWRSRSIQWLKSSRNMQKVNWVRSCSIKRELKRLSIICMMQL